MMRQSINCPTQKVVVCKIQGFSGLGLAEGKVWNVGPPKGPINLGDRFSPAYTIRPLFLRDAQDHSGVPILCTFSEGRVSDALTPSPSPRTGSQWTAQTAPHHNHRGVIQRAAEGQAWQGPPHVHHTIPERNACRGRCWKVSRTLWAGGCRCSALQWPLLETPHTNAHPHPHIGN